MKRQGFDRIIGQSLAKRILTRAAREQQPAHAYLFLGLEGTGKLTTAIEFAKALNCEHPIHGNACDKCDLCRLIEHGNLPDVRVWSPDGKNTKIEQMREMRDLAVLKPMRARWKVNIIEQGDTLNEESANCILKLVEEPPNYLVNILLYRSPASVLPTIRSRCQIVRFTQVNTDELVERLLEDYGITNDQASFLAAYSQGCPGKAIRLIGDTEFLKLRDVVANIAAETSNRRNRWLALKLAEYLRGQGKPSAAEIEPIEEDEESEPEYETQASSAEKAKKSRKNDRDSALGSLEVLLVWYRDLLAAKFLGDRAALVNIDRREKIAAQAAAYENASPLMDAIDAILQAKRNVIGNANPQIAIEALLVRLMG